MPARSDPAEGSGHGDGQDLLPADRGRQPPLLLLFVTVLADVRRHDARVQRQAQAGIAVEIVLLLEDLLVAHILEPHAAVLLGRPHQQIALLPCPGEDGAVDSALLAPTIDVRRDLGLEKPAHRGPK